MADLIVRDRSEMTFSDTLNLGKILASSGYFSDAREAAQAVVKILAGRELGLGEIASMTGIYIVKGRVSLSANLIAAVIRRSGVYSFRVKELSNEVCSIEFYERNELLGVSTFSKDDAKQAGLLGNETYTKYPRNMLYARAMSNGARWYVPDVFAGPVYTPDELGAVVDTETGEIIQPRARTINPPAEIVTKPKFKNLRDMSDESLAENCKYRAKECGYDGEIEPFIVCLLRLEPGAKIDRSLMWKAFEMSLTEWNDAAQAIANSKDRSAKALLSDCTSRAKEVGYEGDMKVFIRLLLGLESGVSVTGKTCKDALAVAPDKWSSTATMMAPKAETAAVADDDKLDADDPFKDDQ